MMAADSRTTPPNPLAQIIFVLVYFARLRGPKVGAVLPGIRSDALKDRDTNTPAIYQQKYQQMAG
jgi:hypothetical protein